MFFQFYYLKHFYLYIFPIHMLGFTYIIYKYLFVSFSGNDFLSSFELLFLSVVYIYMTEKNNKKNNFLFASLPLYIYVYVIIYILYILNLVRYRWCVPWSFRSVQTLPQLIEPGPVPGKLKFSAVVSRVFLVMLRHAARHGENGGRMRNEQKEQYRTVHIHSIITTFPMDPAVPS